VNCLLMAVHDTLAFHGNPLLAPRFPPLTKPRVYTRGYYYDTPSGFAFYRMLIFYRALTPPGFFTLHYSLFTIRFSLVKRKDRQ
jgi:hypothetical protein